VIDVVCGDITEMSADAIVNAAQSSLLGGGGVDGAIHAAAGPSLLAECHEVRRRDLPDGLPPGEAVVTGAGDLPARFVIHTVGPIWYGGDKGEPALLASCYRRCLDLAREHGFASIAFPAISCGVFGYPLDQATRIAVDEAFAAAREPGSLLRILFCCFTPTALQAYRTAIQAHA